MGKTGHRLTGLWQFTPNQSQLQLTLVWAWRRWRPTDPLSQGTRFTHFSEGTGSNRGPGGSQGVQECSLAWNPGDPPGTYLWTQEDAEANNHITAPPWNITVALWAMQYLQGGAKPLSSIHDPGVPPLPKKAWGVFPWPAPTLAWRHQLWGCKGTDTVLYSLGLSHLSKSWGRCCLLSFGGIVDLLKLEDSKRLNHPETQSEVEKLFGIKKRNRCVGQGRKLWRCQTIFFHHSHDELLYLSIF